MDTSCYVLMSWLCVITICGELIFFVINFQVIKVNLPNFEDRRNDDELSPEEIRSKMKEKGIQPPRPWMERPFYISCTGGIFEPYVPPEGDGKISPITVHVSIKRHWK